MKRVARVLGVWDWRRFLMHLPVGVIAPLLVLTHDQGWIFALGFILFFIVYEITEDLAKMFILKDKNKPAFESFIDVQGAIAGMPIGALFVWIVRLTTSTTAS